MDITLGDNDRLRLHWSCTGEQHKAGMRKRLTYKTEIAVISTYDGKVKAVVLLAKLERQ